MVAEIEMPGLGIIWGICAFVCTPVIAFVCYVLVTRVLKMIDYESVFPSKSQ
jgi:hypothetical protein